MNRSLTGALLALTLVGCGLEVAPPQGGGSGASYSHDYGLDDRGFVAGELIVGYQEGASAAALAAKLGGTVRADWPQIEAALIVLPDGLPVLKAQATARRLPGLRYAEPNYVHRLKDPKGAGSVNATSLSPSQLGVTDSDFDVQWMHRQMNSEGAWDQGVSGEGVRIGIHDDFIDHRHPDLVGNMFYPGFDGFKASQLLAEGGSLDSAFTDAQITPETPHDGIASHGSSVAGTAAAVANDIGGLGTAYGASIVPLAINEPEDGALVDAAIVYSAIFAVLGPDLAPGGDDRAPGTDPETGPYVHIVNMSWGSDFYSQVVKDTMDFMLASGIVLVTSAGNTPTEGPSFPAWNPGLINVAATLPTGERTSFSNRGSHLDVAAPGENIWVPTTRGCIYATPDGSSCSPDAPEVAYTYINGTSFSSPAAAGTAALVLEASAERDEGGNITGVLSAAQVTRILRETASQPAGYSFSDLGAGIVDSEAAVARALEHATDPVEDGGSLVVDAVLASDPDVRIPSVGLTLLPDDEDAAAEFTQTSDGALLVPLGLGLFQEMPAGSYTLQASGPYSSLFGGEAATAETDVDIGPGDTTAVQLELDVDTFDDPFEPNNAPDEAAELQTDALTLRASLYDPGAESDTDVYALPVTAGDYRVNYEAISGAADAALTVYAEDGSVLAENDDNQSFSTDPLAEFAAPEDGLVYVEVTEVGGAEGSNSPFALYNLDVAPVIGDETEPNGSAEVVGTVISNVDVTDAQNVPLGSALNAELSEGDADIFALEVGAGETLVADVETVESGEPDTLVGIYNEAGEQVAFNDDANGRESRAFYTSEDAGTYYVVVVAWDAINPDNATTGPYGLMLTSYLNPPTD